MSGATRQKYHDYSLHRKGVLRILIGNNMMTAPIEMGKGRDHNYIRDMMHSYTLPMRCLSGLGLSLLLVGAAVCGHCYQLGAYWHAT